MNDEIVQLRHAIVLNGEIVLDLEIKVRNNRFKSHYRNLTTLYASKCNVAVVTGAILK